MASPAPSTSTSSTPRKKDGSEHYVGRYRRLESIGKGSFAVVYKAIHPENNALIAIKTVQHAQLKGKLKSNLFSEISILRSIHHPHIVGLIDILESTNHIHLIMEFCQLGDLATFVKKRDKLAAHPVTEVMIRNYPNPPGGGFNEVIVRHFAKQLASALEFLRSKNLVHRDLKPQNLLLNPPASWIATEVQENRPFEVSDGALRPLVGLSSLPCLKIADFGFARHLPTTTMAETLCGSPLYMAPEILRYEKYDAKADLWSVGTVLYELMVGKPPFRAANHVDLLRKIERTLDKFKFPDDLDISDSMRTVIRGLLRRMPTERISWDAFFQSAIIKEDIPGLVEADRQQPEPLVSGSGKNSRASSSQGQSSMPGDDPAGFEDALETQQGSRLPSGVITEEVKLPVRAGSLKRAALERPSLTSQATAPQLAQEQLTENRPQRSKSHVGQQYISSSPRPSLETDRLEQPRPQGLTVRELRERAAQDVAFERDYVMVEKRAVEVNAFADELAASPQIHGSGRPKPGTVARRATTQATPTISTSAPSSGSSRQQMAVAVRPETMHQRQLSYDRRYGPSKSSAQSAIAAALNMVNFRIPNYLPLSLGKGPSPPQGYGAFPSYPTTPVAHLNVSDHVRPMPLDEDQGVLITIEECATRSDVVYGFAEVKYKQLVPVAPSNDNALGMRRAGTGNSNGADGDDEDLTVDAIISISEEALVLYVKALSILTNTINLAGNWWSLKNRGEVIGEISSSPKSLDSAKSNFQMVGIRINHVVQWARTRFNECLEKSEYVSRRLVDAQKKLPLGHPGHPNNNSSDSGQDINLSSSITAEKLMYDRALEMSRAAAVNELVGEDLPGCEVSYLTAVRLLEAVLEVDEDPAATRTGSPTKRRTDKKGEEDAANRPINGIEESDRRTVLKIIESMKQRLATLRKKIAMQAHARRNSLKGNQTPPIQRPSPPGSAASRTPPQ